MTGSQHDKDQELEELMRVIEPASHRLAQIEERAVSAVKSTADRTSLAAEWLEVLRVRPIFTTGLALAGSAALLLLSPTAGILAALLG